MSFLQQRRERFSNTGLQNVKQDVVIDVTNASVKLSVEANPQQFVDSVKQGEKIAVIGKSVLADNVASLIMWVVRAETGSIQINGDQASSIPKMKFLILLELFLKSWLFSKFERI